MKPLKEPKTFKRPRLYFQDADGSSRIRIIFPNGTSEWLCTGAAPSGTDLSKGNYYSTCPCWSAKRINEEDEITNFRISYGKDESPQEALRRMKRYDFLNKFPEALYLGEL